MLDDCNGSNTPSEARQWFAVDLEIKPVTEELITWNLWETGAIGIETRAETRDRTELSAYFDILPNIQEIESSLRDALSSAGLPSSDLRSIALRVIVDEDWLRKWKEGYEPFPIGSRFLITPTWKKPLESEIEDRIIIELDPGMAFGTGTHETTQLCLEALETYWRGGNFLDVGTGTGILAIAAALMQQDSYIIAFDIDSNAISVARDNARLNHVDQKIEFDVGTISDYIDRHFDLVVANLTIDILELQLSEVSKATSSTGTLVMSGLLVEQIAQIRSVLSANGLVEITRRESGEWAMIACRKQ